MEEQWKDIYFKQDGIVYDYRGLYQVSNLGNVKSLNYNHTGKEKILKPGKNKGGYQVVALSKDGKAKWFRVNRLIAFLFILNDNPEHKTEVNHIDENKENNSASNLEWVTPKQNSNHGTRNKRVAEALSIFVYFLKPNGEKWFDDPLGIRELSRKTGISYETLRRSLYNKRSLMYGNGAKYDSKYTGSIIVPAEEY